MTHVQTIATATHVAFLYPMTGSGMLVCPRPADDVQGVAVPGPVVNGLQTIECASLHESDWNAMMKRLWDLGWTVLEDDETGGELLEGMTGDGREVFALYGNDPIVSDPDMDDLAAANRELRSVVGLP